MREVNGRRFVERHEVRIGDEIAVFGPGDSLDNLPPAEQTWTVEWKHQDEDAAGVWFECEMGVQVPIERGELVELVSRASERVKAGRR